MISTVFGGSVILIACLCFTGVSTSLRSTPCGSDKGAPPIRDLHLALLESGLDEFGELRAGTRKSGNSGGVVLELVRRQVNLSIMMCLTSVVMVRDHLKLR